METNITKSVSVRQTAALQSYLHYLMSFRRASPNTIKAYAHDIAAFLTWCAQSGVPAEPNHITKAILFRYLSSISHLSPNTARRRVHAISSWFQYLIDSGEIGGNPARGLPLPKRERSLPRYPTPDQSRMLLAAARSPLERAVIWLLLTTGLRRAELIGLNLDDLRADGSELLLLGKGHRERMVPLPHQTQQVLASYLEARGRDPGPLILNRASNRLGPTSLRRIFQRLVRRAGLAEAGFTLHSMRHAYATMLIHAGVDIATIRDLMGHSDVSVTSIYLHSDVRSKREGVELLPILQMGGGSDDV